MEMAQSDFDRMVFFEHACKLSETAHANNPLDADNLTRWGGALLELAQFQAGAESTRTIEDAVSKLEKALEIDPRKHGALWVLGNALTSQGFFMPDYEEAKVTFAKASLYFQQAVDEQPGNEIYVKSLEMSGKAPELHLEIQRQIASQQAGGASTSNVKRPKKIKNSDLTYDVLGWVILAVAVVAWVGMARSQGPPSPP